MGGRRSLRDMFVPWVSREIVSEGRTLKRKEDKEEAPVKRKKPQAERKEEEGRKRRIRNMFGEVSETAWDKILRDHWRKRFGNKYDDNKYFDDTDGCRECKENKILETVINKLHNEWFKGTNEDDDNLEGIIDYLEPTLYDGFIDSDDEEYKERKRNLYKNKVSEVEKLSRTRGNIATIRAGVMDEILKNGNEEESSDKTYCGHESNLKTQTLTRLHSSTWATKWFKRLVAYAKCNRDSYERENELAQNGNFLEFSTGLLHFICSEARLK
ncbi:hypothetical protein Tco_0140130 [Tanacetum coccineum]